MLPHGSSMTATVNDGKPANMRFKLLQCRTCMQGVGSVHLAMVNLPEGARNALVPNKHLQNVLASFRRLRQATCGTCGASSPDHSQKQLGWSAQLRLAAEAQQRSRPAQRSPPCPDSATQAPDAHGRRQTQQQHSTRPHQKVSCVHGSRQGG